MKYIMLLVNFAFLLLKLKSRKIVCQGQKQSIISQIFYQMSLYLLSIPFLQKFVSQSLVGRLMILYPTIDKKVIVKHYYAQKLSLVLLILFVGTNLLFLKDLSDAKNSILQNGNQLLREDDGGEETFVALSVYEGDNHWQISYPLSAKKYTEKEMRTQMKAFEKSVETYILGENPSLDRVECDLNLKDRYEGYAFEVAWESNQYSLVDSDGTVQNEELKSSQIVIVTAILTYDAIREELQIPVCVYPKEKALQEREKEQILKEIQKEDEAQKSEDKFILPNRINNKDVTYALSDQMNAGIYMLGLCFICVILYFAKDRDLEQKMKQREKEMDLSYAEFVSQFVLLAGAGMSVRGVLEQLAKEETLGLYLLQELKILMRDLENGVLEADAIDAFGKRCGSSSYIKFSGLLVQNRKKGNSELLKQLQWEVQDAFTKRKNDARKRGEEAGTKLLLPMMGMLLVVMVVIVLPAFLSFQL